ncbi:MAG: thioredoxin family protein, partial [Bacteroidota bacterium]
MRLISLFFVGAMSLLMLQAQEPAMTVNFLEEENWAQARELAAEQDKFIFVDAYTEWCGWCKVQDKNTFTNEDVGNLINEHFVSVKLDFERGDGVKLARKYRIQSYPTLLFFTSDGRYVGKKVGYDADIDNFMADVMDKMKPENYFTAIGDPDVLDPGFPEFYVNNFGPNGERTRANTKQ